MPLLQKCLVTRVETAGRILKLVAQLSLALQSQLEDVEHAASPFKFSNRVLHLYGLLQVGVSLTIRCYKRMGHYNQMGWYTIHQLQKLYWVETAPPRIIKKAKFWWYKYGRPANHYFILESYYRLGNLLIAWLGINISTNVLILNIRYDASSLLEKLSQQPQ